MDRQQSNQMLEEKKKELTKARKQHKRNQENETGAYSSVEFEEEIRQLEIEVEDLKE